MSELLFLYLWGTAGGGFVFAVVYVRLCMWIVNSWSTFLLAVQYYLYLSYYPSLRLTHSNGILTYILPTTYDFTESDLPVHPCLKLLVVSVAMLFIVRGLFTRVQYPLVLIELCCMC